MSRLAVFNVGPLIKYVIYIGAPETLLSRLRFKRAASLNATYWSCQRGYVQRSSLLASRLSPSYSVADRRLVTFPATFSIVKEKYDEYRANGGRRRPKHLGMLLASFGLAVAFCDTSHFKGTAAVIVHV